MSYTGPEFSNYRYSYVDYHKMKQTDNYYTYSNCDKKRANKSYECFVTGETIEKGEMYWELKCYNPTKKKRFIFKLKFSVPSKVRTQLRRNPENRFDFQIKPFFTN